MDTTFENTARQLSSTWTSQPQALRGENEKELPNSVELGFVLVVRAPLIAYCQLLLLTLRIAIAPLLWAAVIQLLSSVLLLLLLRLSLIHI